MDKEYIQKNTKDVYGINIIQLTELPVYFMNKCTHYTLPRYN